MVGPFVAAANQCVEVVGLSFDLGWWVLVSLCRLCAYPDAQRLSWQCAGRGFSPDSRTLEPTRQRADPPNPVGPNRRYKPT